MPPVSSSGATLNATMYDTPITVPGIAKLTIVRNSNARRPTKRWRVITYAESRPTIAVSGAEIAATSIVVNRLSHAEPTNIVPLRSESMPKPCDEVVRASASCRRGRCPCTKPPIRMIA